MTLPFIWTPTTEGIDPGTGLPYVYTPSDRTRVWAEDLNSIGNTLAQIAAFTTATGIYFADNYISVQAAVNDCIAKGGGTVQLGNKNYTGGVVINNGAYAVRIRGAGRFSTTLWAANGASSTFSATGTTGNTYIEDMTLANASATAGAGVSDTSSGTPGTIVRNCLIINTFYGLYHNGTGAGIIAEHVGLLSTVSDACYIDGGLSAYDLQPTNCGGHAVLIVNGNLRLFNCDAFQCGYGIYGVTRAAGTIFATFLNGVTSEQHTVAGSDGFRFDGGTADCGDISLVSCRSQQAKNNGFSLLGVHDVHLANCNSYLSTFDGFTYATSGSTLATRCTQTGGRAQSNSGQGINCTTSTQHCVFTGVSSHNNSGYGIQASGGTTDYIAAFGCDFNTNSLGGINNATGAHNNLAAGNNLT
jgi:hypothetical protein